MTCYKHDTALDYAEAQNFCLGMGALLVEFWDEIESDLVRVE